MIKFDLSKIIAFYNRMSKRERTIGIVALSVVLILVTDQLIVKQIFKSLNSLNQRLTDTETNIKRSIRLLSQKDRMNTEIERYKAYSVEVKSPEEETAALLKHIEELANGASVNILYAKPAGGGKEEESKKFVITLEAEGQMAQLVNFFFQIENSTLLLKIDKFTLQPTSGGSSVIKCSATVSRAIL